MTCSQCVGIENFFDSKQAAKDLKFYRKRGPDKLTAILLNAIKRTRSQESTLLDIGGGVGVIQYELLNAGINQVVSIEASSSYAAAAEKEIMRLGLTNRVSLIVGDFVDLYDTVPHSEIVTLNRVICCYPDVDSLVNLSAQKAQRIYAVVFPRDVWWVKLFTRLGNSYHWIRRLPFRVYVHNSERIDRIIRNLGFKSCFMKESPVWQVVVYHKTNNLA
jgi:magnesium-protoporphyrin O-methyltransferase